MASQYQEELPKVEPIIRDFQVAVGHCTQCQRRVQGRHPLQTSDALGAAGVQLGPNIAALVVELHTELGMPLAKVAHVLGTQFGVSVTEGGLMHLLHRTAAAGGGRERTPGASSPGRESARNSSRISPYVRLADAGVDGSPADRDSRW